MLDTVRFWAVCTRARLLSQTNLRRLCAVRVISRRSDDADNSSLSEASIIAIGIFSAAVIVVILGVLIAFLLYKRRRYHEAFSDEYDSGESSNQAHALFLGALSHSSFLRSRRLTSERRLQIDRVASCAKVCPDQSVRLSLFASPACEAPAAPL